MSRMQSSHSGHQSHRLTLGTQSGKSRLQVLDRMYYFHYF